MTAKISIIGAGSANFSLSLIRDICLTPNLRGSTVSFMDVDQGRLDAAHALCRRYAGEVGADLTLEKTTGRRESLKGADFVINTALVVGNRSLEQGFAVGARHGYRFGGSYHIMHDEGFWINYYQYRLFEDVTRDMLEICPAAWCLQVANPVFAATGFLAQKYPQARVVGLCHGFGGVYHLAETLGLGRDGLTFEVPGVNHFVWLTRMYHKGEDVFPRLDRWIEEQAPEYWKTCHPCSDMGPVAVDLYKRFGAFPIGDTCTPGGGSWPWWYHADSATEERWQEDPAGWWSGYFVHLQRGVAEIKRVAEDTSSKVTSYFPAKPSGEVMVPIIESIVCDIPRVIIGNIPNSGDFVPGVPRDIAVEIPLLVSKRGIEGIQTHGLPQPLVDYILRDRVAPVRIELEAYEKGSKELLLQLIMMDPWTRSLDQARALMDDILAMPGNEEMHAHYR